MQEHARPPQPNFVMPPHPTHHAARRHSCIPLHPYTPSLRRNPPTHPHAPIPHPFDTCVSYAPAMTIRQIRHLSDTNHLSPDTKSVEMSNVPLSGPTTPPAPDSRPASRRNPPTPSRTQEFTPCNSFVSYGPDTTMRRMRRLPDTNKIATATKSVSRPYLACYYPLPKFPPHTTQPTRRNTIMTLTIIAPSTKRVPAQGQNNRVRARRDILVPGLPNWAGRIVY